MYLDELQAEAGAERGSSAELRRLLATALERILKIHFNRRTSVFTEPRRYWNSANFAITEFSEVRMQDPA
jgi:hypothetical protein